MRQAGAAQCFPGLGAVLLWPPEQRETPRPPAKSEPPQGHALPAWLHLGLALPSAQVEHPRSLRPRASRPFASAGRKSGPLRPPAAVSQRSSHQACPMGGDMAGAGEGLSLRCLCRPLQRRGGGKRETSHRPFHVTPGCLQGPPVHPARSWACGDGVSQAPPLFPGHPVTHRLPPRVRLGSKVRAGGGAHPPAQWSQFLRSTAVHLPSEQTGL